jgi:tRNA(Ile)-lysidine synthase TilS/MesJ
MIDEGDKIAVGVSGGKDSVTLLCVLKALSRFYPKKFSVAAECLDTGAPGLNFDPVKRLCEEIETEFILEKTYIYKIVFEVRKESNPCSLCANLRRGALNNTALTHGMKKVALGHHYDDTVETFLLNLFNEGRIDCFSPVTYLDRKNMTVIRPLIYTPEADIRHFVKVENIEIAPKTCPADGHTDRQKIKDLINGLEKDDHGLKARIFGAIERGNVSGFKEIIRDKKDISK